jgi:hypothetical protein
MERWTEDEHNPRGRPIGEPKDAAALAKLYPYLENTRIPPSVTRLRTIASQA